MPMNFIQKIVTGGQTGVDRAALDAAEKLKVPFNNVNLQVDFSIAY